MAKKRRRGSGEGAIYQRTDGVWAASIEMPRDPVTQNRRRQVIYGKTRKEVADKLVGKVVDKQRGILPEPNKATLGEYILSWLDGKQKIRPNTRASYKEVIDLHIIPTIGGTLLAKVQPSHIQNLITEKQKQGLSDYRVKYIHAIIHAALEKAMKMNLIYRNHASLVEVPQPQKKKQPVFTSTNLPGLMEVIEDDPNFAYYYLSIATGCRRGEVVGLRWSDVDLKRQTITINQSVGYLEKDKEFIIQEPKTTKSRRVFVLPENAVAVLRKYKGIGEYQDNDFVFAQADGSPYRPQYFTLYWKRLLHKYDIPHVPLKNLRHTNATLLDEADVSIRVASERLGHSRIGTTGDVYQQVTDPMQYEAARRLNTLLPKPK
jgi:integrase